MSIFSSTMRRIWLSDLRVCSRSGKAMLSYRFIEPNSAPSWNNTPNSFRTSYSSCSRSLVTSRPATFTEPRSGFSSPTSVLRNTDLPVPEGPSMTETSPAGSVSETSCQMTW